jgi:membrane protease YdiL (CAAX protease family)
MGSDERILAGRETRSLRERLAERRETAIAIVAPVLGVTVAEALLYSGRTWPSIWAHFLTLILCTVLLRWTDDVAPVQALALVPLFRLVNLGMPVFFQLTAYWFPLIYGPLVPALVYVDRTRPDLSVPFGWRRGVALVPVAIVISAFLAEVEQAILQSEALIPTWSIAQVAMITVVMVCFVGFVEEYLFRGILQGTLQQELGRWPGIVLASAVFGLMHSGYGVPAELLFAGVIGFVFGVLYDYLDSLVFVTIIHGVLNVFLFAVYPIKGSFLF